MSKVIKVKCDCGAEFEASMADVHRAGGSSSIAITAKHPVPICDAWIRGEIVLWHLFKATA